MRMYKTDNRKRVFQRSRVRAQKRVVIQQQGEIIFHLFNFPGNWIQRLFFTISFVPVQFIGIDCDQVKKDRDNRYKDLSGFSGLTVYKPDANFIFCRAPLSSLPPVRYGWAISTFLVLWTAPPIKGLPLTTMLLYLRLFFCLNPYLARQLFQFCFIWCSWWWLGLIFHRFKHQNLQANGFMSSAFIRWSWHLSTLGFYFFHKPCPMNDDGNHCKIDISRTPG